MSLLAALDFGAQQPSGEQDFSIQLKRLIDQAEACPSLQIALEVDVPGKGLYRLLSDGIRNAGLIGGGIERGANGERAELNQTPRCRLFEPRGVPPSCRSTTSRLTRWLFASTQRTDKVFQAPFGGSGDRGQFAGRTC